MGEPLRTPHTTHHTVTHTTRGQKQGLSPCRCVKEVTRFVIVSVMSRPERSGTAESFYSHKEAAQYESSARMNAQQRALADRALQLLDLPQGVPALLLDAGCGTGYSGLPLEKAGHTWIGTDISFNMLSAGVHASVGRRGGRNQVVCDDLGRGLAFRNGIFDGCVSISAVQWLCHASRPEHDPERRVRRFFTALRAVLAAGARAVLQIYPEQPAHMEMLRDAALAAGFSGGLVVDYPWSERSKKLFLVLVSPSRLAAAPQPQPQQKQQKERSGGGGKSARTSGGAIGKSKPERRGGGSFSSASDRAQQGMKKAGRHKR
jgi:18S rRNA (guanine1575-N7)-methyltransferase